MLGLILLTSTLFAGPPEGGRNTHDGPSEMLHTTVDSLIDALWSRPLPVLETRSPGDVGQTRDTADMDLIELAHHWIHHRGVPTATERLRLLQVCRGRPDLTLGLLAFLPTSEAAVEIVRSAHQRWPQPKFADWLVLYDETATDLLLLRVSRADPEDAPDFAYRALVALAQRAWKQATPILMSLAASGGSYGAAASRVLLEYFAASELPEPTFAWRRRLQRIALDGQRVPAVRALALAGVMSNEWAGRARWFLANMAGLIDHEANDLPDILAPITTVVFHEPEIWLPALVGMVGSPQRVQHLAAVAVLALYLRRVPDVRAARALLPWTTSAKWAGELGYALRLDYFDALGRVDLPQSLPALAQILKRTTHLPYEREPPEVVVRVARAVRQYCRPRLKEPLRRAALQQPQGPQRDVLLGVLLKCGMYAWSELHIAVLRYLEHLVDTDRARAEGAKLPKPSYDAQLGRMALAEDNLTDDQIVRFVRVLAGMNRTGPLLYPKFLPIVHRWRHPHVARSLLRRLSTGQLEGEPLVHALDLRGQIRALQSPTLAQLVAGSGSMAGFAAVLSGDRTAQRDILEGDDQAARFALFAAARWAGELLPVSGLRPLLAQPAMAPLTRRYLAALDDAQARSLRQGPCGQGGVGRGFPRTNWPRSSDDFPHNVFVAQAAIQEYWQLQVWAGDRPLQEIIIQDFGTVAEVQLSEYGAPRQVEHMPSEVLDGLREQFQRHGIDGLVDRADERPRRRFPGEGPVFSIRHATPECASAFVVHDPWRHAVVANHYWQTIYRFFEIAEQAGFKLPLIGLPGGD